MSIQATVHFLQLLIHLDESLAGVLRKAVDSCVHPLEPDHHFLLKPHHGRVELWDGFGWFCHFLLEISRVLIKGGGGTSFPPPDIAPGPGVHATLPHVGAITLLCPAFRWG